MLAFVWFTTLAALQGGIGGVGVGEGGGKWLSGFGSLIRRKQVDSVHYRGHAQLARKLSAVDLVGIGVGATIGAGVYILIGTVAREQAGPALVISLFIVGIAAALSALCYAKLACRCPSAGSAYHYTYICIGEAVTWMVGWSLILEYTIGASAVARGITPNLTLQGALLSWTYTVLDYAQTGLIAALFFFKMMEWWYQSAEERMSASTVYPPPPPPPPKGVELELRKLEGSVEAIHEN